MILFVVFKLGNAGADGVYIYSLSTIDFLRIRINNDNIRAGIVYFAQRARRICEHIAPTVPRGLFCYLYCDAVLPRQAFLPHTVALLPARVIVALYLLTTSVHP